MGEFAYLGGAILGCAVLGREEDRRWPGRLAGLALGILVIGGVTLGGFANWMPFMDALHVGEAAPLGLVGALALARSLGRGPPDPADL